VPLPTRPSYHSFLSQVCSHSNAVRVLAWVALDGIGIQTSPCSTPRQCKAYHSERTIAYFTLQCHALSNQHSTFLHTIEVDHPRYPSSPRASKIRRYDSYALRKFEPAYSFPSLFVLVTCLISERLLYNFMYLFSFASTGFGESTVSSTTLHTSQQQL
jgi:hypothetical protein